MLEAANQIHKKKMLLIDDDPKLLIGLKAVMSRKGYEVISATNGNEGIQLAKDNHPDIIICDIMMPPPNGFQVKNMMLGDEATADIPFIFLTARTLGADKIAGLQQGADDYVTKPFNIDELTSRVEAILRRNDIGYRHGQRDMEAALEKMRHSISANLGHEFRTPLTVILANMEMAMREKFKGSTENLDWYLESSLSSAQKLSSLVEDMIILNDIDQGGITPLTNPAGLDVDVEDYIRHICAQYEHKKLNILMSIESGLTTYLPQEACLKAISHLVDNACKFSPEGAKVMIALRKHGLGGCSLTVENEGSFIPRELREKVFDRFYQVDQGDARAYNGLGVGLTIARAVARACRGDVNILDSETGCKVRMTLPSFK